MPIKHGAGLAEPSTIWDDKISVGPIKLRRGHIRLNDSSKNSVPILYQYRGERLARISDHRRKSPTMPDRSGEKHQRARKMQRNLVAKHARSFNQSAAYRDRKKTLRDKYPAIAMQEALEAPQSDA